MAIYHEHLKYHEDDIEKHEITAEEIAFLMALQKEMNTQDHVSQEDPRYWVIRGTEKEYGIEEGNGDGAELIDDSYSAIAHDMEEAFNYIKDNLLTDINDLDGLERKIELTEGIFHPAIKISWSDDDFDDYVELFDMGEVAEWLRDQGYDYRVAEYRLHQKNYDSTMFLTQKAAEDHLRKNYYHYSDDAHTYAMTAWRNPEADMLWKILQEVNWESLLQKISSEGQ